MIWFILSGNGQFVGELEEKYVCKLGNSLGKIFEKGKKK